MCWSRSIILPMEWLWEVLFYFMDLLVDGLEPCFCLPMRSLKRLGFISLFIWQWMAFCYVPCNFDVWWNLTLGRCRMKIFFFREVFTTKWLSLCRTHYLSFSCANKFWRWNSKIGYNLFFSSEQNMSYSSFEFLFFLTCLNCLSQYFICFFKSNAFPHCEGGRGNCIFNI